MNSSRLLEDVRLIDWTGVLELSAVAERLEAGIFSSLVRWELPLQFASTIGD